MTKKNKVLIIDDESGNRGLIKLALEMKFPEIEVEEYENGLGIPERIKNSPEKYLAAVVDYWMKGITGAEIIREIKKVKNDFPVILASGSDADSMREKCPQADFVLQKPIKIVNFATVMKIILLKEKSYSRLMNFS